MKNPFHKSDKPYLIAECAYAHEGDINYLKESIVRIAGTNCVDAIKFHILLDIETYMCPDHELYENIKRWLFSPGQWMELIDYAYSVNLDVIILADDIGSMQFLKSLESKLSALEIHACSLNDIKMLDEAAQFNIPLFLGIGGSTIDEISFGVDYLNERGKTDIILMYGFQNFPTKFEYVNFRKMQKIKEFFKLPIGYADHTAWDDEHQELVTIAGFLLGAHIIEKHFALEKGEKRIDFQAAISCDEFRKLCTKLNILQKALGDGSFALNKYEENYGKIGPMKKAVVAGVDIEVDEKINFEKINFKRTKNISPIGQKESLNLLGRRAKVKIRKGSLVTFDSTYQDSV